MTVVYASHLATTSFPGFIRTMFLWKGSVWKLVYAELFLWCTMYLLFSLIYRFALNDGQQALFEKVCNYCYLHVDFIPFEFVLGYYITLVLSRWSNLWINLGFLDSICLAATTYLRYGDLVRAQMYRRNIVRLVCLYQIMVYRVICRGVRKMYPTMQSLVDAGYIHEDELDQFADNKFWMPIKWAMYLVRQARKEGLIKQDFAVQTIYEYILAYRGNVIKLWAYDWVPIPLLYTQVTFTAVRAYFIVLIFGRQFLNVERTTFRSEIDIYVPILTIVQFILYVGWCKMGETLVNPFGDDDDDFDYKYVMTRNLNVGMDIVTGIEARQPLLIDEDEPSESPTALLNAKLTDEAIGLGSLANMNVRRRSSHAPVIMVKRSVFNSLTPVQTSRFRSNSLAVSSINASFVPNLPTNVRRRASIDAEANMFDSQQNFSKKIENPKLLLTQHSCPSNLTEEKILLELPEPHLLTTLAEDDENLLEHGFEEENSDCPQAQMSSITEQNASVLKADTARLSDISLSSQNSSTTISSVQTVEEIHNKISDSFLAEETRESGVSGSFAIINYPDNKTVIEIRSETIPEEE